MDRVTRGDKARMWVFIIFMLVLVNGYHIILLIEWLKT